MAEQMFNVKIISPNRIFYEGRATMIELNTTDGEIGVYAGHVPTTLILRPGIMTITSPEEKLEAAVHAGFVEILKDRVTVMAEIAEWPDEIDENRAEAAKERAEKRLKEHGEDTNILRAEIALQKSLVRLRVSKKLEMSKTP